MRPRDEGDSGSWSDPGLYQVSPGVYRIPLPMPNDGLRAINVYALTGGDDLVLIDAGWALDESRALLADALAGLGAGLGDIREFLITHVHRDHYTQAVVLRREFGNRVALGQAEEASLKLAEDPDAVPMSAQLELLRRCGAGEVAAELAGLFHGVPHAYLGEWERPDEWLSPGRRPAAGRTLDVLHTPGHTSGHMVFADPAAGLLFSGDHVLPHITPSIALEGVVPDLPLHDYLASLRMVLELPDHRLLPAHGPVTDSAHARVRELLRHHDERLDVMVAQIAAGASTAYEVALRLTWTRRQRRLSEMDIFNRMLAILETGAHVDLAAAQGRLRYTISDGVRTYATA